MDLNAHDLAVSHSEDAASCGKPVTALFRLISVNPFGAIEKLRYHQALHGLDECSGAKRKYSEVALVKILFDVHS
jgi:hypothetical protein